MRWPAYFILVYLIISLQMGLSGFINWGSAAPNLVLPVAVFVAINARREEALVGTLLLGLIQDLFTQHPMGLYGFAYGMVGLFVLGTQPVVYRDHPLTHFFVTFAAALLTNGAVWFNEWAYPILHSGAESVRPSLGAAVAGALYTAAVAPVILGVLARLKKLFAFKGRMHAVGMRRAPV